jgi:hypothetical protein
VSGKKNERNIPAILISVSRRQGAKRLKKNRAEQNMFSAIGVGVWKRF